MKQSLTSLPAALSRAFRGGWRNNLYHLLEGVLLVFLSLGARVIPGIRLYLAAAAGAAICFFLAGRLLHPQRSQAGGHRAPGWAWSLVVVIGAFVPVCVSAGFSWGAWLQAGLLVLLVFGAALWLDLRN